MSDFPDPEALVARLHKVLPPQTLAGLEQILRAAADSHPIYAVGGTVRDLVLGRPLVDLDLAVEGDAIALVSAALPRVRMTTHARFGTATATVSLDDLEHADLAVVIGANPASNHPRLITQLVHLRRRGGKVIVINPLKEIGHNCSTRMTGPRTWTRG